MSWPERVVFCVLLVFLFESDTAPVAAPPVVVGLLSVLAERTLRTLSRS